MDYNFYLEKRKDSMVLTAPQVVEPPWPHQTRQAPASAGETMSPLDSTTSLNAAPTFPKLYPLLPVSTPGKGEEPLELNKGSPLPKSQRTEYPCRPLREAQQPPMIGEDGNYHKLL